MRSKRLTAEESREMAVLVNEIGVKQVLELLRAHQQQSTPFTMVSKPRRTVHGAKVYEVAARYSGHLCLYDLQR